MSGDMRTNDRGENDCLVLAAIMRAAAAGKPCPTNDELCGINGARSPSYGSAVISRLEKRGLIRVERFNQARRVTIVATGKSTEYTGGGKPHWRSAGGTGGRAEHVRPQLRSRPTRPAPGAIGDGSIEPPAIGPRVYRDPCFHCGVRGDLGCEHQAPVREWAA